jgi:hypothetical protein
MRGPPEQKNSEAVQRPLPSALIRSDFLRSDEEEVLAGYWNEHEAAPDLDPDHVRWLLEHGVAADSVDPTFIKSAKVIHSDGTYTPSSNGRDAFVFPEFSGGWNLVDFTAWSPDTNEVSSRLGVVGLVGEMMIGWLGSDQTIWGSKKRPVPIFPDVLSYLRANWKGTVVRDWRLAAHALADIHIAPQGDAMFVDELKRRLTLAPVFHGPAT